MTRNPIFMEIRDLADELASMTEIFNPDEINRFTSDSSYYSALLSRDIGPDQDDLDRLKELKQIYKEHK